MEHPNVKLEIEMKYEPQFESYVPGAAGLAPDCRYRGRMSFDECVDAIISLADFLSGHNLLDVQDNPNDATKVSMGTEQLLLEALYLVHDRWHAAEAEEEEEEGLTSGNGDETEET